MIDFDAIRRHTFRHLSEDEKRRMLAQHSAGPSLSALGIVTPHIPEVNGEFISQPITSEHPVFIMTKDITNTGAYTTALLGGLPGISTAEDLQLIKSAHTYSRAQSLPLLYSSGARGAVTAFFPSGYKERSIGILYGGTPMNPAYIAGQLEKKHKDVDFARAEIGALFMLFMRDATVIVGGGLKLPFIRLDIAGYERAIADKNFTYFRQAYNLQIPTAAQLESGIGQYIPVL
ncbi:MAG: hypothetical protein NUV65_02720 [Candidatus Roizmanbacteria bacterium]|nr:hypothetical protein [Candidatus Roizmanbacteria bacterium]